ncbi:MAG: PL29 family lyase N-terminal domain-containing protein [Bacteroidales bacterium]|nr:PL29 family lyase N-terminal domain-containing protein [Bacteroidales bacterium]
MKNNLLTLTVLLCIGAATVAGCTYDDTAVNRRIADLDGRLSELERVVSDINTNIGAMRATVKALEENERIVDIHQLEDGSGLSVTFSGSGTPYIIRNGTAPAISVEKFDDGNFYWTLDGEFLLVDGEKVPATAKTLVPQIKVEDNKFMLSFDGRKWQEIGTAGGAGIFKNVIDGEDSVTFVLSDSSEIVIPKEQKFALHFNELSIAVNPGTEISVPYTVTAADEGTLVRAYGYGGFEVLGVLPEGPGKGTIKVKVPATVPADGEIMAMAVNSKGVPSFRILTFEKGSWTSEANRLKIPAEGGEIIIAVATNLEYDVIIPETDKGWLKTVTGSATKAIRNEQVTLIVSQNKGAERQSVIRLAKGSTTYATYTIVQEEAITDDTEGYKGNIEDWTSNGSIDF